MLEFSVDVCSFLLNNKTGSAVVHCKAGKGRTGSMICAYLIFAGIAKDVKEALELYAVNRSDKLKGVTVPSQLRYLHHFVTYLNLTFEKPFYKQIPRIFRNYSLNNTKKNLLFYVFDRAAHLFSYGNNFIIRKIKIGPFQKNSLLNLQVLNFGKKKYFDSKDNKVNYRQYNFIQETSIDGNQQSQSYSVFEFLGINNLLIDTDSEVIVEGAGMSFFVWLNFFYITLETLIDFIVDCLQKDSSEIISFSWLLKTESNLTFNGSELGNTGNHHLKYQTKTWNSKVKQLSKPDLNNERTQKSRKISLLLDKLGNRSKNDSCCDYLEANSNKNRCGEGDVNHSITKEKNLQKTNKLIKSNKSTSNNDLHRPALSVDFHSFDKLPEDSFFQINHNKLIKEIFKKKQNIKIFENLDPHALVEYSKDYRNLLESNNSNKQINVNQNTYTENPKEDYFSKEEPEGQEEIYEKNRNFNPYDSSNNKDVFKDKVQSSKFPVGAVNLKANSPESLEHLGKDNPFDGLFNHTLGSNFLLTVKEGSICFDFIKSFLIKYTEFITEYIQLSDLNLIYDKLTQGIPSLITNDKLFTFTIGKNYFDKYNGKDYKDLTVEVTYKLLENN